MLRVERKRFINRIKGDDRQILIKEIQQHESGRDLQEAIEGWSCRASAPVAPPAVSRGKVTRRCSVIINTVDRSQDLGITLKVLEMEWDDDLDELIIVLGPTEDDSREVVERAAIPTRLVLCPERNLALSRNLGLQAAAGEFIVYIDDDASPSPGWLRSLIDPLEMDAEVGISAGYVLDGTGDRFLNRHVVADALGRAYWLEDEPAAIAKIRQLGEQRAFLTATGCNMAFRRSALDLIGGFDPFYQYFLEETDLVWRLIKAGFQCRVAPASTVLHRLGANLSRTPAMEVGSRSVIIRSQIHFIGKFGKSTFPPAEIESCLWERVLLDLEKIAWDSCQTGGQDHRCHELQIQYLHEVGRQLRLDSLPDSSSLSHLSAAPESPMSSSDVTGH
jgi:GT2 family glycosyltransferase